MKTHYIRTCATLFCALLLVSLCVTAVKADGYTPDKKRRHPYSPTPYKPEDTPTPCPTQTPVTVYTPSPCPTASACPSPSPCPPPAQTNFLDSYSRLWFSLFILLLLLLIVLLFTFRRRKPATTGYTPSTPYQPSSPQQQSPDRY